MKRFLNFIGVVLRKALLSVFVITDDLPFSLNEFYKRTVKSRHRWLIYFIVCVFWGLCIVGIVKTVPNLSKTYTTFNVHAQTDKVSYITGRNNKDVWWVENVEVSLSCSDNPEPALFSGRLIFGNKVRVEVISWKDQSAIISLEGDKAKQLVLEAWSGDDELAFEAYGCAHIRINDLVSRKEAGQTFVFPISGEITAGGEVSFRKNEGYLLKSGRIYLLDKGLLVDHYYSCWAF